MQTEFRGIFLTSETPAKTAGWYQQVAGLELERMGNPEQYVYWKFDRNGVQFAIHDARLFAAYTYPTCLESNVTHLYFKIASQQNFLEHLKNVDISPYCLDEVVITVIDPDGRKVMFGTA